MALSGLSAASVHGVGKLDTSVTPPDAVHTNVGPSCWIELAEDGSADYYCNPGATPPPGPTSWPAGTFPSDGQWHFCGGDHGVSDPFCGPVLEAVSQ